MEKTEEIISKFITEEKIAFTKINTDHESIPDDKTRSFLSKYGLPQLKNIFIIEDLLLFDDFKIYEKDDRKIIIGQDSGGFLCIDRYNGVLQSFDPAGKNRDYFVNSCISDFIECLYYYKKIFINIANEISEDEEINIYNKLVDIFFKIDPAILNSEENWWSEIIEPLTYSSELF